MDKHNLTMPDYGVLIESHVHEADFKTKLHKHDYNSLLYVVSGQGRCVMRDTSFDLASNTVVMLRAGQSHQFIDAPNKAMTIFVTYFDDLPSTLNNKISRSLFEAGNKVSVPAYSRPKLRKLLRQMLHEQEGRPLLFETAIQQCLGIILVELLRIQAETKTSESSVVQHKNQTKTAEVLADISKNIYEHYSLAGAARMVGISQRQFTNLCRKLTGKSFNQYINQLRTKRAAYLLKNTTMSVAAIAFEVGYEELSTFYRAFKRFHNTSPTAMKANSSRIK